MATFIAFILIFLYFVFTTFILLRLLPRIKRMLLILVLPLYWMVLVLPVFAFQPVEKILVRKNIYLEFGHGGILWINILVIEFIISVFILIYYYWSGKSE